MLIKSLIMTLYSDTKKDKIVFSVGMLADRRPICPLMVYFREYDYNLI